MGEETPENQNAALNQTVKSIIGNLEATFNDQKAKEIQTLYNGFTEVITKNKAHISNILTAMELVKQEVLLQKIAQIRAETQKP